MNEALERTRQSRDSLQSWAWTRRGTLTLVLAAGTVVVVAVLSAYFFSTTRQTIYGARAEIALTVAPSSPDPERDIATHQVLLTSHPVLAPVAQAEGLSIEELETRISVESAAQSYVLHLTVADPDPERAQVIANSITQAYLESEHSERTGTEASLVSVYLLDEPLQPQPARAIAAAALAGCFLAAAMVLGAGWLRKR